MSLDFVEHVRGEIFHQAENTIRKVFPEKTAELDELLREVAYNMENLPKARRSSWDSLSNITRDNLSKPSTSTDKDVGEPPFKYRKMGKDGDGDYGRRGLVSVEIQTNTLLLKLMENIRPEIIAMMESCNTVRTWVMLLMPKMEDGNNFGVSVQEETMAEIKAVETECAVFLEGLTSYFFSRGKVASKMMKFPRIQDYARFIVEEDEKQFVNLRHILAELRNFYSALHDLIMKNFEKIKKPKSANHISMY